MSDAAIAALNAASETCVLNVGNTVVLHVVFPTPELAESYCWNCPRLPEGVDALLVRANIPEHKRFLDFYYTKKELETFEVRRSYIMS